MMTKKAASSFPEKRGGGRTGVPAALIKQGTRQSRHALLVHDTLVHVHWIVHGADGGIESFQRVGEVVQGITLIGLPSSPDRIEIAGHQGAASSTITMTKEQICIVGSGNW